jgi:uncharacterized membrane protein
MRDVLLIIHFSGLIIGAGAGFSIFCIGLISKTFKPEYKLEVALKLIPLRYISYLGLLVLLGQMPWLHAKLSAVGVLVLLSLFGLTQIRRAQQGQAAPAFKNLALVGKLSLLMSITIVICAVMTFH